MAVEKSAVKSNSTTEHDKPTSKRRTGANKYKQNMTQLSKLQQHYDAYDDRKDELQNISFIELLDTNPLLILQTDLYGRRYGISERYEWDSVILKELLHIPLT